MREFVSKNIDGITDLIVIAPIKDGFIDAYDNVTYATRLKLVAEALNRIRVAAREYERVSPYTDTIERILNILNFRITVFDEDMYGLVTSAEGKPDRSDKDGPDPQKLKLQRKRYLCIIATFEGGWEPYMRLIWHPFGALMDLLFCNCEDWVSAYESSCEEYLQWVRDHLVDPSIFYAVNGLSTRDGRYLMRLERMERQGWSAEELAQLTMPHPDNESAEIRRMTQAPPAMTGHLPKTIEVAFEALTVLYRLADYYPPQWYTGGNGDLGLIDEGHRLIRFAKEILRGWDDVIESMNNIKPDSWAAFYQPIWKRAVEANAEPLAWYLSGSKVVEDLDDELVSKRNPDPDFDRTEVQGGILKAQGSQGSPVQHGALLLFTIHDAQGARDFVKGLRLHFAKGDGSQPDGSLYRTIGFTESGLLRIGVHCEAVKCLPKEFREGMALRSGTLGDYRENHSRNWILPERNGPLLTGEVAPGTKLSRIDTEEIDLVIQLRSTDPDAQVVIEDIKRLAEAGGEAVSLEGYELLQGGYDPETGQFRDHFKYLDGLSQPSPILTDEEISDSVPRRDRVKAGEVLVGYANDRTDAAPGPFDTLEGPKSDKRWRRKYRREAQDLARNGSYLVVRKIGQDVDGFDEWLSKQAGPIAEKLGYDTDKAKSILKAALMGRDKDGNPLVSPSSTTPNDFDYAGDPKGVQCPFAAHIRRANPRHTVQPPEADNSFEPLKPFENNTVEFDRPTPRLVRRGMLFGKVAEGKPPPAQRGLMFMAYNASIAEQYEVIQRWLNGGNSTDVAAMQNDPLTGVTAKEIFGHAPNDAFRFFAKNSAGEPVLLHVPLPGARSKNPLDPRSKAEPGRHPFTPLHWGLYLLVPSRTALATIVAEGGRFMAMPAPLEVKEGQATLDRLDALPSGERGAEWKRFIEDVDAKDPAMQSQTPHLWSAIRWIKGGAYNLREADGTVGPVPPPAFAGRPGTIPQKNGELDQFSAFSDQTATGAGHAESFKPKKDYDWDNPVIDEQNVVICAGIAQTRRVLADWDNFSNEEQMRRMEPTSGAIYVNQRPDNHYQIPRLNKLGLNYEAEAVRTNKVLMAYGEVQGFREGYNEARKVLKEEQGKAINGLRNYFKIELRRLFLMPTLGGLMEQWYGLPDGKHIVKGGWSWKRIDPTADDTKPDAVTRRLPRCPGDFLAPSRHAYFPRPGKVTSEFGRIHGDAIRKAAEAFVAEHRDAGTTPTGYLAKGMFDAFPDRKDDAVLARTLVGTMVGALPPMDGNIRGILVEWFGEKTFWRHQAALRRKVGNNLGDVPSDEAIQAAIEVLRGPVSQAMCKRPAPDLLYRTAVRDTEIELDTDEEGEHRTRNERPRDRITVKRGDLVIVSQVSAAQRSLYSSHPDGDISIVFGGKRAEANQIGSRDINYPVHACPAQKLAMGAMMGILAALLDFGTVEALPASLIVRISDW